MFINYKNFEFVPFKDYVIDHDHNSSLLETLDKFVNITKNTNLNYYLTGSISLSLISNKVYRTWKDIDIIIENDTIFQWLRLFPKKDWYYYDLNKKFMKIYDSSNNNYIELSSKNESLFFYHKKHLKIINMYGINIGNPKPMFFWKKNVRKTNQTKDHDDEEFYSQYIK